MMLIVWICAGPVDAVPMEAVDLTGTQAYLHGELNQRAVPGIAQWLNPASKRASASSASWCSLAGPETSGSGYPPGLPVAVSATIGNVPDSTEVKAAVIQLPLDWSGIAAEPVHHVNQVIAQIGGPAQDGVPDGIYVSFGRAEPLPVFGSEEERERAYQAIAALKVSVHGRIHVSRSNLRDLVRVLEEVGRQYDALVEHARPPLGGDQE